MPIEYRLLVPALVFCSRAQKYPPAFPRFSTYMSTRKAQHWVPLSEAAKHTPYTAEYLSLLARKKKLRAKKIANTWHTTSAALDAYLKKQFIYHELERGRLRGDTLRPAFQGAATQDTRIRLALARPLAPDADRELLHLRSRLAHGLADEADQELPIELPPESSAEPSGRPRPRPASGGGRGAESQWRFATKADVEETSRSMEEVSVRAQKYREPARDTAAVASSDRKNTTSQPSAGPAKFSDTQFDAFIEKFSRFLEVSIESHLSAPHKIWRGIKRAYRATLSRPRTLLIAAILTLVFVALPLRFVFGFFDETAQVLWDKMRDAQTVMGFQPGTHANEILILDKKGDIAIRGHIETEGQLRSFAPDGIAPIVVDSRTKIENLNTDFIDGFSN